MDTLRARVIPLIVAAAVGILLFASTIWQMSAAAAPANEIMISCAPDGNGSELALAIALLQSNGNPGPDTIVVSPTGEACTFTTINIQDDNGNGGIGTNLITDVLTIRALGPGAIFTRGGAATDSYRLFESEADLSFENVILEKGNTASGRKGGAILAHQGLTLTNVIISDNISYGGGGVFVTGPLILEDVTLLNNETKSDNDSHGGAIWAVGDMTATAISVTNNTAFDCGCGGDDADGGGIYVGGNALISTAVFSNNQSVRNRGGGLFVAGDLTLDNSVFISNTSGSNSGGGISVAGQLVLSGTQFMENKARTGGGVFLDESSTGGTITNSSFERNIASDLGGAVFGSAQMTIENSSFIDNEGDSGGGVVVFEGTVTDSLFQGNTAHGANPSTAGGGILALYDITVQNSRFISNSAPAGGALQILHAAPNGELSLVVNNVFEENNASDGAAVFAGFTIDEPVMGHTEFLHNTIVRQTQGPGSAIQVVEGTANVKNNIIMGYTTGVAGGGAASVVSDYNLFFNNLVRHAGVPPGPNNLDGDPLFVSLAMGDYHLTADSPAVDSGEDLGVSQDIEGVARPQGKGYDRGAYEFIPPDVVILEAYFPAILAN